MIFTDESSIQLGKRGQPRKMKYKYTAQSTCLGRDFKKKSDSYRHCQQNNDSYKVC